MEVSINYISQALSSKNPITPFIKECNRLVRKRILKVYLDPQTEELKKVTSLLKNIHLLMDDQIVFKNSSLKSYFDSLASLPNPYEAISMHLNLAITSLPPSIFESINFNNS